MEAASMELYMGSQNRRMPDTTLDMRRTTRRRETLGKKEKHSDVESERL